MAEIVLTDENRPLIDAVIRISATRWPEHAEDAEDTLVEAVQELIALRHENAAMREIVQAVANGGTAEDFSQRARYRLNYHVYASDEMRAKARALLDTGRQ